MLVILSKDAEKQYKRLPKPDKIKVKKKLLMLQEDPTVGKKLVGDLAGTRSLRAWPYRIIYEINKGKNRVEVHKIAHRQGAY